MKSNLKKLPDTMQATLPLQTINLQGNKLTTLPDYLASCASTLTHLNISDNPLR